MSGFRDGTKTKLKDINFSDRFFLEKEFDKSDDTDNRRYLTKEKDISDQIIDHSRSMISVINRKYIYEKVNATFCNEHQVVFDSIVGKSLEEVWGQDGEFFG